MHATPTTRRDPFAPPPRIPVYHPNRRTPESHSARAGTILLLVGSAAALIVVAAGGWAKLEGGIVIHIGYIATYLTIAFFVGRWNRGVLPVAASLAILLAIFAVVAGPGWFDRDRPGFDEPTLPSAMLGGLTLALVPAQMVLIAVSMWGFGQRWNVEVEIPESDRAAARIN